MTIIAIDGPAGSGKSTVARALAERLDLPHVDTGAYYRATTLAALQAGVDIDDETTLTTLARRLTIERVSGRTLLDARDVEDAIRSTDVDEAVSTVAAHRRVRAALLDRQRAAVSVGGGVVEGRDAGTAVVPHADLKVWLTATPSARAHRRALDRAGTTTLVDETVIEQQATALAERDHRDRANMGRASDVREIDTTDLTVDEVVERIVSLLEETS